MISGQAPKPAELGAFITPESVPGRKLETFDITDTAAGSITLTAGQTGVFTFDFNYYDIPDTETGRKQFTQILAWPYADFYIDNDLQLDYEYGNESGLLSADQKKVRLSVYQPQLHIILPSQRTRYSFVNNGSSTHTVYGWFAIKYMNLS